VFSIQLKIFLKGNNSKVLAKKHQINTFFTKNPKIPKSQNPKIYLVPHLLFTDMMMEGSKTKLDRSATISVIQVSTPK